MAYNRYRGNSGRVERVELPPVPAESAREFPPREPESTPEREPPPRPKPGPPARRRQNILSGVMNRRWEEQDLLVMAILYLAYRCSGETEMLIALAAYLLM